MPAKPCAWQKRSSVCFLSISSCSFCRRSASARRARSDRSRTSCALLASCSLRACASCSRRSFCARNSCLACSACSSSRRCSSANASKRSRCSLSASCCARYWACSSRRLTSFCQASTTRSASDAVRAPTTRRSLPCFSTKRPSPISKRSTSTLVWSLFCSRTVGSILTQSEAPGSDFLQALPHNISCGWRDALQSPQQWSPCQ
mmetsp:Transcript_98766/g.195820  ORF Transcript_98766/g.195820 Transcript_98766/m.195820 type:complete len:204 (-) Transcript_98766:64-675(-)